MKKQLTPEDQALFTKVMRETVERTHLTSRLVQFIKDHPDAEKKVAQKMAGQKIGTEQTLRHAAERTGIYLAYLVDEWMKLSGERLDLSKMG